MLQKDKNLSIRTFVPKKLKGPTSKSRNHNMIKFCRIKAGKTLSPLKTNRDLYLF